VRSAVLGLALAAVACAGEAAEPPPVRDLVRSGTRPTSVHRMDLDGDGTPEVVVASTASGEEGLGTAHLEVFAAVAGGWRRVFDAEGPAPPGVAGAPPTMISSGDGGFVAQSVHALDVVDLASDGRPEMVTAIASAGATSGPVELWILSMDTEGAFRTEFYGSTARGGTVTVQGRVVSFEFPVYRRNDPGCCPTFVERQTIGHDPATGSIVVLERERRRS
jgi:hypothetical protein